MTRQKSSFPPVCGASVAIRKRSRKTSLRRRFPTCIRRRSRFSARSTRQSPPCRAARTHGFWKAQRRFWTSWSWTGRRTAARRARERMIKWSLPSSLSPPSESWRFLRVRTSVTCCKKSGSAATPKRRSISAATKKFPPASAKRFWGYASSRRQSAKKRESPTTVRN